MQSPTPYHWLLIGDFSAALATTARSCLDESQVTTANSLKVAIETAMTASHGIDLVLVYQSFPDEYCRTQIDRLIGLLPLARWIVCLSEWCDSAARTEQLWPIGWCVPVRDVAPRLSAELQRLKGDQAPLPPTASRDEAFALRAAQWSAAAMVAGRSAFVMGDDLNVVSTLRELLAGCGFRGVDSACEDLNVIAVMSPDAQTLRQVAALRASQDRARILVATDLVTTEQSDQLRTSGTDALVSQLRFIEVAMQEASLAQLT